MVYRIEIAKTGRAGCGRKECKDAQIKIAKNEVRFGSQAEIHEHVSWFWRHWGCVTPHQIASLKKDIEDDVELFDGYEDMEENMQAKIRQALTDGHVADEDWKGDVERNRPGKRGFRSPAKAKEAMEEGNQNGSQSPSKPAPKKRARAKKDNGDDTADEGPAPKKSKAATKRGGKKIPEEENGEPGAGTPPPKKSKGRKKTVTKVEQKDGDSRTSTPPPKTAKGRKKAVAKTEQEGGGSSDGTPPKKVKGRKKKIIKGDAEVQGIKDEGAENDVVLQSIPRKATAPRKATLGKKIKDEASETEDDHEDEAFEPIEAPPRSRAGDKKKTANGTANGTGQASKSKGNKKEATAVEHLQEGNAAGTAGVKRRPGRAARPKADDMA